jgi:heterodisulfide reductase subunit B
MERVILYPGCLVLSRFHEYELASRRILDKLGIEAVGIMGAVGYPFLGTGKARALDGQ